MEQPSEFTPTEHFMRDLIDQRLAELRSEMDAGNRLQAELDVRQDELRRSMLRISGALQVLSELSAANDARTDAPLPLRRVADA